MPRFDRIEILKLSAMKVHYCVKSPRMQTWKRKQNKLRRKAWKPFSVLSTIAILLFQKLIPIHWIMNRQKKKWLRSIVWNVKDARTKKIGKKFHLINFLFFFFTGLTSWTNNKRRFFSLFQFISCTIFHNQVR